MKVTSIPIPEIPREYLEARDIIGQHIADFINNAITHIGPHEGEKWVEGMKFAAYIARGFKGDDNDLPENTYVLSTLTQPEGNTA